MRTARALVMAICVAAFVMLIVSGPGTRLGLWTWQTGFALLQWAFYTGVAGGIAALVLVALTAMPRFRPGAWVPFLAMTLAVAAFLPPVLILQYAKGLPSIHDITTDPFDPPQFVALLPVRKQSPNGFEYGGEKVAKVQQQAYPDIKSAIVQSAPADTVQKAIDAARSLGWEIVSSDAPAGRIEATDTTLWFGFKDDVIIRVRAEGSGSRVDVRSVSRLGGGDVGANAKRIRKFLEKLA